MDTPEMNLAAEQFQLSAADRLMNYLGQSRLAKGIGATGLFLAAGSGVMLAETGNAQAEGSGNCSPSGSNFNINVSDTIDINTTESTHGPVDLAANDGEGSSGTWSFSSPGVASTTVGFQDSHASGSGTLTFSYFNSANNYVSKNDGFKWSCKVSKPTPTPTPTKTVEKPTPTKAKPTPTKTTEKPTPTSTYHETQSTTPVAPKTSAKVGPTKAKSSSAEHSASVVANSSHGASAPETTPDNASSTNGSTAGLSLSSSNGDSSLGVITSSEISRAAAISSNHETSGVAGWIPLTGIGVLVITGIGGVIWYRRREDGSHTA